MVSGCLKRKMPLFLLTLTLIFVYQLLRYVSGRGSQYAFDCSVLDTSGMDLAAPVSLNGDMTAEQFHRLECIVKAREKEYLERALKPFNSSEVVMDGSIFLFETRPDIEELSPRTLCALESAAEANKDRTVFLLISLPTSLIYAPTFLDNLENVKLRTVNPSELMLNNKIVDGEEGVKIPAELPGQRSKIMGLYTLNRFGGIYFDQDIISLHKVPFKGNFLSVHRDSGTVLSSVIGLGQKHPILAKSIQILNFLRERLGGQNDLALSASEILSKATKDHCSILHESNGDSKGQNRSCSDVTLISPKKAGDIVSPESLEQFYNPEKMFEVLINVRDRFAIHYFGQFLEEPYAANTVRYDGTIETFSEPSFDNYKDFESSSNSNENYITVNYTQPLYRLMERFCFATVELKLKHRMGTPFYRN